MFKDRNINDILEKIYSLNLELEIYERLYKDLKQKEIKYYIEPKVKAVFSDVDYIDIRNVNEYIKKQDVIDLCYMLQDKSSEQGQVIIEQIISAVKDMEHKEHNMKNLEAEVKYY